MKSNHSPNDSYSRLTTVCSYFYEMRCWCSFFNFPTDNFNLKQNYIFGIKFADS